MENPQLMVFVCLAVPLSMMLFVFKGRSRVILSFLLTGFFLCLFAGEINGFLRNATGLTLYFLTVNITPVIEEILKALPIILLVFFMKPERRLLLECAVAVGVGFATMENACLFADSPALLTTGTVIARGFGAGMMHGVSTLAVGFAMTFVGADKKLNATGTVAALAAAVIYHSIYNILVQSAYPLLGVILPLLTFIPLLVMMSKKGKMPDRVKASKY